MLCFQYDIGGGKLQHMIDFDCNKFCLIFIRTIFADLSLKWQKMKIFKFGKHVDPESLLLAL